MQHHHSDDLNRVAMEGGKFIRGRKKGLTFSDLTKKINLNWKAPIQKIKVMATKVLKDLNIDWDMTFYKQIMLKKNVIMVNLNVFVYFKQMSQVSKVMKTSKGRDKICQILQYSSALTHACYEHSNIHYVQKRYLDHELKASRIASNVKHSVKNGRKIFKLLNFLLEFKRLQFVLEKRKPLLYKTALALCRVFNFFYYFFDNILWASKIGKFSMGKSDKDLFRYVDLLSFVLFCISNLISGKSPKQVRFIKDCFCFLKVILKMVILAYKIQKRRKKIVTLTLKTGTKNNKIIEQHDKYFYVCKYFLNQRIKCREDRIKLLVKFLQFLMLLKRIRIPPFQSSIGDIAYASLGLFATLLSTAKNLSEKQKIVKYERE